MPIRSGDRNTRATRRCGQQDTFGHHQTDHDVAMLAGFNASHSMGAILFGLVYGFLAVAHSQLLFHSVFLLVVGLAMLGGLFALGKVYWFSIPFRGIGVALACYVAGVAVSLGCSCQCWPG